MQDDMSSRMEGWRSSLCEAAKEVFSTMLATELRDPAQPEIELNGDVTAMIGMAGPFSGVLSVRCSSAASKEIAVRMLGLSGDEAESQASDAVGEACNMVAGTFKNKVAELRNNCMLSVPTVIVGDSYSIRFLSPGSRIDLSLMFDAEVVSFSLEVSD